MLLATYTLSPMPRKPLAESEKRRGIAARMLPSIIDKLQELADADRRTLSFMLEEAAREYIERHAAKLKGRK